MKNTISLFMLPLAAMLLLFSSCESTKVEKAILTENTVFEDCDTDGAGGIQVHYHIVDDVPEMDAEFLNKKLYEAYNEDFAHFAGVNLQEAGQLTDMALDAECMEGIHFNTEVIQNEDGFLEIAFETSYYPDASDLDSEETYTGDIRIDLNEMMEEFLLLLQNRP